MPAAGRNGTRPAISVKARRGIRRIDANRSVDAGVRRVAGHVLAATDVIVQNIAAKIKVIILNRLDRFRQKHRL